jgi:multicomponent K+:H+ antiporter subunit D
MGHWIIVPVVLPAFLAAFIVVVARYDLLLQRVFSLAGVVALLAVAIALWIGAGHGPEAYRLGDWPAPFGIVLVLDRLAALMLVLAGILGVATVLYAMAGFDRRGRHFHALFQFQLMGVNGAFLTGDIFNLFVFFEVLLIASYGMLLHGAAVRGLRAGFHYIAVNLTGSTLFLFAVGLLYAVTGTLNAADLIGKVPLVPEANQGLLRVAGLLLLLVFAIKAALVPVHLWLPSAYAAAGAPVAALFAIMTKVGAYAIIRVYTMVFGRGAGNEQWLAGPWLLPAALVTAAVGMTGVLAARGLRDQACYALLGSMGTLLAAVGLFSPAGTAAALYYLASSTVGAALLFLVVDLLASQRGEVGDAVMPAPPVPGQEVIAGLFFLAALLIVGLPPLSGFFGKLLILDAARDDPRAVWVWAVILVTTLIGMIGFARSGTAVFWKRPASSGASPGVPAVLGRPQVVGMLSAGSLLTGAVLLSVAAGPAMNAFEAMARELYDTGPYVASVLGAGQQAVAP